MDQKLLSAFHVRLLRLETDIENITQALSMREKLGDKVEDRAANLRREAENLRGILRTFAGLQPESLPEFTGDDARGAGGGNGGHAASPDTHGTHHGTHEPPRAGTGTPAAPIPSPGTRAGRLNARRRRGVRFQARIDIWDHDLEALVRCGELSATEARDPAAVAEAVEDIFDRWLQQRLGVAAPPPRPEPPAPAPPRPAPARPGPPPAARADAPPHAPPDAPMAGDSPASQGDRRRNADRRAGLERRGDDDRRSRALDAGSDEWGILMDDDWGGPDVRGPDDRRAGFDRRGTERRRVIGPFS